MKCIFFRTKNAVESFHRIYNSQFYKSHPTHTLGNYGFTRNSSWNDDKIRSIETECHKNTSFNEMQKINGTIMALRNKHSKDLL